MLVTLEMFNYPGVFYFNQPDTIYDKTIWEISLDKLEKLKQYQLVVADFSSEHYGADTIDYVYNTFKSIGINFILLSHEPADHLKYPRLFFYPHWYHWARNNFNNRYTNVSTTKKNHKVSCLNGVPRPHRIYNFLTLNKTKYFNDVFFSMHRREEDLLTRRDDVTIPNHIIEEWNSIRTSLNLKSAHEVSMHKKTTIAMDVLNPAYTDSYINLVTETTVIPKIFVTEKTWKPISSGQLFLIIGNPGTIEYLRSQGVDVFDDIIDHKYYDHEPNWQLRITKVHELLNELITKDLYKINQDTLERRQLNRSRFFSGFFDQTYQTKIQDYIDELSNTV